MPSCLQNNPGGDLLSHRVSPAVPSALEDLTSEFEMGSGVAPPESPPEIFWCLELRARLSNPSRARSPSFDLDFRKRLSALSLPAWGAHLRDPRYHLNRDSENNGDQAARPISTGQLHALQRFHTRPINVVVYDGPLGGLRLGIPDLEVSFPLRCFQRLSIPDIATRRCHWHDNRITSGPSTRVLSYYGQGLARILRPRQIGTELSHDVLNPARVPL